MECWAGNPSLPYCRRDTGNSTELIAARRSRQGPLSPAVVDAPWTVNNPAQAAAEAPGAEWVSSQA